MFILPLLGTLQSVDKQRGFIMEAATKKDVKKTRAARGTGRLYKRTKDGQEHRPDSKTPGVFWIQYTSNGKRVRQCLTGRDGKPITALRLAEAERKRLTAPLRSGNRSEQLQALTAVLAQTEAEHVQDVEDARPVLRVVEAWEAYLKSPDRPDSGEGTLRNYAGHWKRFTEWLKKNQPEALTLQEITPQMAQDYAADLTRAGLSPNSFNKHTALLKLVFRVMDDVAGKENPFEKTRRKNLKTDSRRELTIAELKELLQSATGDLQTLLYLGTFTGLRLGDCCTLIWGETDLDRGLIRRVPNKTAKSHTPVLIGIPVALHNKLSEIPPRQRKGYVLPRFAETYLYRNTEGRPVKQSLISIEIQEHFKACEIETHKAGTGKDEYEAAFEKWKTSDKKEEKPIYKRAVVEVGFHSLRHTYASRHAEAGTPQSMIQANMGHGNPAMTQHYTHVNEAAAIRIAGALDLTEQKPKAKQMPAWIKEKFPTMTAKNWETIKAEILED